MASKGQRVSLIHDMTIIETTDYAKYFGILKLNLINLMT